MCPGQFRGQNQNSYMVCLVVVGCWLLLVVFAACCWLICYFLLLVVGCFCGMLFIFILFFLMA